MGPEMRLELSCKRNRKTNQQADTSFSDQCHINMALKGVR